ncbi:MAG: NAD(P)H-dependent oxidoreductase, partial [Planctomycetota bacterium]
GASTTHVQLRDYELPIFSQDTEAKEFPSAAKALHRLFKEHDALLIACPEYNSSITPVLKNVIDWVSRPFDEEPGLGAYANKVACLLSASPGALGGLRGLRHVREILSNINVLVTPGQFALSTAHSAFAEDGKLSDEKNHARLAGCIQSFVDTLAKQTV